MNPGRLMGLCVVLCLAPKVFADTDATLVDPYDPTQHWEADYESGLLWRFTGSATPLSYTVLPQELSIKSPLLGVPRPFFGGDLVLRNRFSLLGETIIRGPEHHFIGATASGTFEWWDKKRTGCLFFAAGGGIGWLDSKGHEIRGAQGEDFNFTWLAYGGARIRLRKHFSGSLGIYFQHISNRNLNSVNPGLNAAGPMITLAWHL
jgi:hypothetical protein